MRVSRRLVDGAWVTVGLSMAAAAITVLATTHPEVRATPAARGRTRAPVAAKVVTRKPLTPPTPLAPQAAEIAPPTSQAVVIVVQPEDVPTLRELGEIAATAPTEQARRAAIRAILAASVADPTLDAMTRALLLDAAGSATSPSLRALALQGVRLEGAQPLEVACVLGFLYDGDARVRRAVAHIVRSGGQARGAIAEALVQALDRETDERAARALADALIDVGGGDPAPGVARLATSPVVAATPDLARRVRAAQALLAAGVTDGTAIVRALDGLDDESPQ